MSVYDFAILRFGFISPFLREMITLFAESKNDILFGSTHIELKLEAAWTSYLLLILISRFSLDRTWIGFYEKQNPS